MNPEYSTPAENQRVHNPLEAMQSGEQVICEIRRHPIGLVGIYGIIGFVLVALAVIVYVVIPGSVSADQHSQAVGWGSLALLFAAILGIGFAFINHIIYWGNRWIVTTDSVTQVQQTSLFRKQSSQLSLENLEDVTTERNGILEQLFNFGMLKAETAGERSKFVFPFCPHPDTYAQHILNARERFMQDVRAKEDSRLQNGPAGSNPNQTAA